MNKIDPEEYDPEKIKYPEGYDPIAEYFKA